jgi:ribosomal protein S18 acetylase RimI-like enzyme
MITRTLKVSDISAVTEIHLAAFSNFFLTQMGRSFLELYYKSFIKSETGFGIGVFDDEGNLIGFSITTTNSKSFNKNLIIQNLLPFSVMGLQLMFTNPKALIRLFKNLRKSSDETIDDGEYGELFSIAVDPGKQSSGIGKIMLEEVERIAQEKGCQCLTLTTDFYNNGNVINFYKKMGYAVFYDFIAYPDRRMYKMIKHLN